MKYKHRNKLFKIEGVSQSDHIYKSIVKNRSFYEIDLLEYMYFIKQFVNKTGSVAIDVGANIGNHSIFFQTFLSNHVICIEPNPDILPTLKRNLKNNISNFSIYDCALGETASQGKVVSPDASEDNIGMSKIDVDVEGGEIKIITLDSMLADWRVKNADSGAVSLLKIDVEGMELAVLKGAQTTLKTDRPELFIEALTVQEFNTINRYLNGLGYKMLRQCSRYAPMYHFSYMPSRGLLFAVRYSKIRGAICRAMRKNLLKVARLKNP